MFIHPQRCLLAFIGSGSQAKPAISMWIYARLNRKKQIPDHFPPILCMLTLPVVRRQRESKYQTIVQEAQRKSEVSADKWKRKPPNYKSLGGETEEIGCPYGVFMGPEQSGRSLNEIVHVERKKVTNYSAGKKAKNLSLQSQTPDRIPFQPSCRPISKDKWKI